MVAPGIRLDHFQIYRTPDNERTNPTVRKYPLGDTGHHGASAVSLLDREYMSDKKPPRSHDPFGTALMEIGFFSSQQTVNQ